LVIEGKYSGKIQKEHVEQCTTSN